MANMNGVFGKVVHGCAAMGAMNAASYLWKAKVVDKLLHPPAAESGYRMGQLSAKQLHEPVDCRYGSSDLKVFNQIFFLDEYGPVRTSSDAKLIVDCGANVGYSTAYFLSKYPTAQVIAVEPDRRNYEVLTRNTAGYGARAVAINAAVWSHKTRLALHRHDRGEWATQVKEANVAESADIDAVDIPEILNRSKHDRIDLLKIDIEGAEGELFSHNYESWIDRVETIVIELHGDSYERIFHEALKGRKFGFGTSGELTIASRLLPAS